MTIKVCEVYEIPCCVGGFLKSCCLNHQISSSGGDVDPTTGLSSSGVDPTTGYSHTIKLKEMISYNPETRVITYEWRTYKYDKGTNTYSLQPELSYIVTKLNDNV